MWNGLLDALQRPSRAIPDRGSLLKNNQLAVLHNILNVLGVLGHPVYKHNKCITGLTEPVLSRFDNAAILQQSELTDFVTSLRHLKGTRKEQSKSKKSKNGFLVGHCKGESGLPF